MTSPVELFNSKVKKLKKTGKGWTACCPAHDDKSPSLSIAEGDNGNLLVRCYAGCEYRDIMDAVGLDQKDGFAESLSGSARREYRRESAQAARQMEELVINIATSQPDELTDEDVDRLRQAEQRIKDIETELADLDAQDEAEAANPDGYSASREAAERLAYGITQSLCRELCIKSKDEPEQVERLGVNVDVLQAIITGCFWSGVKSKVFMLGEADDLLQFTRDDAGGFIIKRFGQYIDVQEVTAIATELAEAADLSSPATEKLIKTALGIPGGAVMRHLKYHNQRDSLEWRVDMFATASRVELIEDKARIILRHRSLTTSAQHDPRIIEDYKEHFPRFDEFIDLVIAARFAGDRKKAYLWLFACTDWGKGLLLGALSQHGLVVNLSIKEVEAMFEGKPVGRSPLDFKRAFILAIDEFKTVKAELKQLQSTIELAPKHQLTSSVEIFTKLFLSAESVASLVGENGVEDQFANRMSIFREHGSIEQRPLFIEVGKDAYRNGIADHIAARINGAVDGVREMGRAAATKAADDAVTEFHKVHGLDTVFQRFSDSLPEFVEQFRAWLRGTEVFRTKKHNEKTYLLSAAKTIDEFIDSQLTQSEAGALRRKKPEIIALLSVEGEDMAKTYRIPYPTKAVLIHPLDQPRH